MALPTNDDFSNRELSIEELEAIAAGGWLSSVVNFVEHEASVAYHYVAPVVKWIADHWPKTPPVIYNGRAK